MVKKARSLPGSENRGGEPSSDGEPSVKDLTSGVDRFNPICEK
jgi:hypothetical protein